MLVRVAFFAALGGFLFGYDLGLIGGALLGFTAELGITSTFTQEAIVGALKLGSFFGTFLGGALMLRYGRRPAIAATAITGLLGPLIMASAPNAAALVIARVLSGLGIGVSAIVVPAYLAELAPAAQRGAMVQVYEIMLTLGMLTSVVVDWALSGLGPHAWRWMVGLPAIPGAAVGLALLVLPESPRWQVMHGRLDEALATLQATLRGTSFSNLLRRPQVPQEKVLADAEDELLLLWSSVEKDKQAVVDRQAALLRERQRRVRERERRGRTTAAGGGVASSEGRGTEPLLAPSQHSTSAPASAAATAAASGEANAPQAVELSSLRQDLGHTRLLGDGRKEHRTKPPMPPLFVLEAGKPSDSESEGERGPSSHRSVAPARAQSPFGHRSGGSTPRHRGGAALSDGGGLLGGAPRSDAQRVAAKPLGAAGASTGLQGGRGASEGGFQAGSAVHNGHGGGSSTPMTSTIRHASPRRTSNSSTGGADGAGPVICAPGAEPHFLATLGAMLLDIIAVFKGPESRACIVACCLAIFNQATASTAVINYAPVLLSRMGSLPAGGAIAYTIAVAVFKVVGVVVGLAVVDSWGRRPLLIWGAAGCCVAMVAATAATAVGSALLLLAAMCAFILAFSVSWAGVYWVVVSEVFSMAAKSPASSAATSLLFLSGAVTNMAFLGLVEAAEAAAYLVFAGIAAASGLYVWMQLPETKGRTLADVQALMNGARPSSYARLPM